MGLPGKRCGINLFHGGYQVLQPRERKYTQKEDTNVRKEQRNMGAAQCSILDRQSSVHCSHQAEKVNLGKSSETWPQQLTPGMEYTRWLNWRQHTPLTTRHWDYKIDRRKQIYKTLFYKWYRNLRQRTCKGGLWYTQPDPKDSTQATRHGRWRGIYTPKVTNVIQSMRNKKPPGADANPNEVWKCLDAMLLRYLKAIYNGWLREGVFPKRWKEARIISIFKPGKEGSDDVNNYRPTSLIHSGGKVLEKLLINRINHYVYSRGHMNENQFEFRPLKRTIDAEKAIKTFI